MSTTIENSDFFQLIPIKSKNILVEKFDNGDYLLTHTILQYRIKINEITTELLKLIDGKKNIKELSQEISIFKEKKISETEIYEVLYNQLGKYQIIENTTHEVKPQGKPDYLKLSFSLISKEKLEKIIKPITFLFSKKLFYTSLTVMLLGVLLIGFKNDWFNSYSMFTTTDWVYLLAITFSSVFIHELGHASACMKHGGNHREIGFGFYLTSPVLYADVSDIWKLTIDKRIIVNLAGIYMQVLLGFILGCIYLYNGHYFFLGLMTSITGISLIYNLNPFFRTDGYWVLSDLLRINNLRKKSNEIFINSIKLFPFKILKHKFNQNDIYFLLYGILSNTFIFVFLGAAFYYNSFALINFPIEIYKVVYEYIKYDKLIELENFQKIALSFFFYFALYRFSKNYLAKLYETKRSFINDVIIIVFSSIFFLSAIGKILSYDSFLMKSKQYPFYFDGVTQLIIAIELFISTGFISFKYGRITAKISFVFLIIITVIYTYGFFNLNIKECDCFGHFSFLNSNNIGIVILKNSVLAIIPFYFIYRNKITDFKIKRTVFALVLVLIVTFQFYLIEVFNSRQLAFTFKGKNIENLTSIHSSNEIEKADYIFFFSPDCPHCIKLIRELNKIHTEINLVGITKKKEYEKNSIIKDVKFKILYWEKKDLNMVTKIVPTLFTVKNKVIIDVNYPNKETIRNIGENRKSLKE